jgi:hypothetical protein
MGINYWGIIHSLGGLVNIFQPQETILDTCELNTFRKLVLRRKDP